uniref:BTB domain-containing protein n=1 Tax=Panagrolaimus davidi TaxID=227884 RepID=A0A914P9B3_9BILA
MESPNFRTLSDEIGQLFISQDDCDITFIVQDENIFAHSLIVSCRSPVLKAMIKGPMTAKNNNCFAITDPDLKIEDFKNFLQFLYTDFCEINDGNCQMMLRLGDMYDVPQLLEKCAEFCKTRFTFLNILSYSELGLQYADTCSLLEKCLQAIPKLLFPFQKQYMVYGLTIGDDCETLSIYNGSKNVLIKPELVKIIAEKCERTVEFNEEVLFEKILKWAEENCKENKKKVTPENLKFYMEEIIPYILFENLSTLTLATKVFNNNLLPEGVLLNFICQSVVEATPENGNSIPREPHYFPHYSSTTTRRRERYIR